MKYDNPTEGKKMTFYKKSSLNGLIEALKFREKTDIPEGKEKISVTLAMAIIRSLQWDGKSTKNLVERFK